VYPDVRLGGVIGDGATLGDGVMVEPGTIVGNRATVQTGSQIRGSIEIEETVKRG
jgi:glucose-1-phosphate thymidylyltransferase